MPFITIYITYPDIETAKKIVEVLMEKRFIACANFFPIESVYWWQGRIENANEIVSLLKTRKENWDKIKEEVKKIHPYEVPCIEKFEVEANEDYEKWIDKETI